MGLFSQIIRTAVNVAVLPVAVARDAVCVITDAADNTIAPATRKQIQRIKDEADD